MIASNFEVWNKIILKHKCGVVVDPEKPNEIAAAIDYVIANPKQSLNNGY